MTDQGMTFDPDKAIIDGTTDVFSTMLMMDIVSERVENSESEAIISNISSMIGLGGGIRGMLAVHCPAAAATAITGALLGMEVEELDEDVKDALGEIANMVAGNVKVSFAGAGIDIQLATPTSVIGDGFRVTGISGAQRHNIAFTSEGLRFRVELLYVMG